MTLAPVSLGTVTVLSHVGLLCLILLKSESPHIFCAFFGKARGRNKDAVFTLNETLISKPTGGCLRQGLLKRSRSVPSSVSERRALFCILSARSITLLYIWVRAPRGCCPTLWIRIQLGNQTVSYKPYRWGKLWAERRRCNTLALNRSTV